MEEVVLCGASAYSKKFYLNERFRGLPAQIKDELKIMCLKIRQLQREREELLLALQTYYKVIVMGMEDDSDDNDD